MAEQRQLAEISDYPSLVAALRDRKAQIGITDQVMDELAGWARGYTGKILGPASVKTIGQMSFGVCLGVLGVKLILVEDQEMMQQMEQRWEQRYRPANVDAHAISMRLIERVKPAIFRQVAADLTRARKKIRPSTRRRIAKQAALARWRRRKKRRGRSRPNR